jgi:hypothetical protein
MPRSLARLSASASSHRGLSSAVFITNIAESDFRYTQEDFLRTYTKRDALAGSIRPFRAASTMSPCKWRIRSIIEMRSRATWDAVG